MTLDLVLGGIVAAFIAIYLVVALLRPEKLTVYARYVRRGGLDINPYRSTEALVVDNRRLVRQ